MTDNQSEKFIIGLIFMVVILIYLYFYNLSLRSGWLLIGGLIILSLSFVMLKSRRFLIFSTALFLMLTATQFGTIKNVMETVRWIPYIVFMFLFLSQFFIRKRLPRKVEGFDIFLFIIIIIMFLSAFYSIDPSLTVKRAGTFLLLYISVFWVIYPEIHSREDIEEVIDLILYASIIPYTISVVLLFFPDIAFLGNRFTGYFLNPNTIGILTTVLLPLILWKAIERKNRWARTFLFFVLLSLVLSGSRSGLLGSFVGGNFYIFMTRKKYRVPAAFLGLIFIILMFAVGEKMIDRMSSYLRTEAVVEITERKDLDEVTAGRFEKWAAMISLIKKRPLLGYGFGTEDILFHHFGITVSRGSYAYNIFLGLTVQLGILGFILFFSPIFYLLFKPINIQDSLIYALKGMLLGGLVVGFFETWIYSVGSAFAFPFWIGVVLLLRLDKKQ